MDRKDSKWAVAVALAAGLAALAFVMVGGLPGNGGVDAAGPAVTSSTTTTTVSETTTTSSTTTSTSTTSSSTTTSTSTTSSTTTTTVNETTTTTVNETTTTIGELPPPTSIPSTCLTFAQQTPDPCETVPGAVTPPFVPKSNVRDRNDPRTVEEFIDDASVEATASIEFDGVAAEDAPMLEEGRTVPMTVTLTVVGSGDGEPLPAGVSPDDTALITQFNEVTVTCPEEADNGNPADCTDFDIASLNPLRQEFPNLSFAFEFTPRAEGEITVVVVVEGIVQDEFDAKPLYDTLTKPFPIVVDVSPARRTWNTLRTAVETELASLLQTAVPAATRGIPVEVTSTFTYPTGVIERDGLDVTLRMGTDGRADILESSPIQSGDEVTRSWTVTPYETGRLGLRFWVEAESELAGEELIVSDSRTTFLQVSEPDAPAPGVIDQVKDTADRAVSTVVYLATAITVVIGAVVAVLGLKWQRKSRIAGAASSEGGSSPPDETGR